MRLSKLPIECFWRWKTSNYYVSGQYIEDEGIMKDNYLKRVNFQSRIRAKLSPKLNLDVNVRPSYSVKRRSTIAYSDLTRSLSFMPVYHNDYTAALTGYPAGSYAQGRHFNNVNFNYTDENGVPQNFTSSLWEPTIIRRFQEWTMKKG